MKLSDAVMLGSTDPKLPFDPWQYNCCLLGVGIHVFHDTAVSSNEALVEAETRWPWINKHFPIPAVSSIHRPNNIAKGEEIISNFAFDIAADLATLEQAVDWIRSVEPPDPEVVATETEVMRSELCEATSSGK